MRNRRRRAPVTRPTAPAAGARRAAAAAAAALPLLLPPSAGLSVSHCHKVDFAAPGGTSQTPCDKQTYSAAHVGSQWLFACGDDGTRLCERPTGGSCWDTAGSRSMNARKIQDLTAGRTAAGGWYVYGATGGTQAVRCAFEETSGTLSDCTLLRVARCPSGTYMRGVAVSPSGAALVISCWAASTDPNAGIYICPFKSNPPGAQADTEPCVQSADPCHHSTGVSSRNQAIDFFEAGGLYTGCFDRPNKVVYCAHYGDSAGLSSCTEQPSACPSKTAGITQLPAGQVGYGCYTEGWMVCSSTTDGPTASPTAAPAAAPSAQPSGGPSAAPTVRPTRMPSAAPTGSPSAAPASPPSAGPLQPSAPPTQRPTSAPRRAAAAPTGVPQPRTAAPSVGLPPPSARPSEAPSAAPQPLRAPPRDRLPPQLPPQPPPAPPPPCPPPLPPPLQQPAVDDLLTKNPGTGVGLAIVATVSGAGPGTAQLAMALDQRCDPAGTFDDLPWPLHPTGLAINGSVHLGCLVGTAIIVTCAFFLNVAALVVVRVMIGDKHGQLDLSDIQKSCLRHIPPFRGSDAVDLAAIMRFPSNTLLVCLLVYQGATFSALRLTVRGGTSNATRAVAGSCALLLSAFPVFLYLRIKSGVSKRERRGQTELGKIVRARVRPWDDPKPSQCLQYCILSERGDWVSRRKANHWVNRWQAAVRPYDTRHAARGFAVELLAMWALCVANLPTTPTRAACGHVRMAAAAVYLLLLVYTVSSRPYRCIRDNTLNAVRPGLLGVGLASMGASFYSDDTGHEAASLAIDLAGYSILLSVVLHICAEGLLMAKGWRATLQAREWEEVEREEDAALELESCQSMRCSPGAPEALPQCKAPGRSCLRRQSSLNSPSASPTASFRDFGDRCVTLDIDDITSEAPEAPAAAAQRSSSKRLRAPPRRAPGSPAGSSASPVNSPETPPAGPVATEGELSVFATMPSQIKCVSPLSSAAGGVGTGGRSLAAPRRRRGAGTITASSPAAAGARRAGSQQPGLASQNRSPRSDPAAGATQLRSPLALASSTEHSLSADGPLLAAAGGKWRLSSAPPVHRLGPATAAEGGLAGGSVGDRSPKGPAALQSALSLGDLAAAASRSERTLGATDPPTSTMRSDATAPIAPVSATLSSRVSSRQLSTPFALLGPRHQDAPSGSPLTPGTASPVQL